MQLVRSTGIKRREEPVQISGARPSGRRPVARGPTVLYSPVRPAWEDLKNYLIGDKPAFVTSHSAKYGGWP